MWSSRNESMVPGSATRCRRTSSRMSSNGTGESPKSIVMRRQRRALERRLEDHGPDDRGQDQDVKRVEGQQATADRIRLGHGWPRSGWQVTELAGGATDEPDQRAGEHEANQPPDDPERAEGEAD